MFREVWIRGTSGSAGVMCVTATAVSVTRDFFFISSFGGTELGTSSRTVGFKKC